MNTENVFIISLTSVVVSLIIAITTYGIVIDRAAIKAGLQKGVLPGSAGVHWVK